MSLQSGYVISVICLFLTKAKAEYSVSFNFGKFILHHSLMWSAAFNREVLTLNGALISFGL